MLWTIISAIILGALAGWIAGKIMHRKKGFWGNVLLGIVGSLVGGVLADLINLRGGFFVQLLISVAGACIVLWVVNAVKKK